MGVMDYAILALILGYGGWCLFGKKKKGCCGNCSGCTGCDRRESQ